MNKQKPLWSIAEAFDNLYASDELGMLERSSLDSLSEHFDKLEKALDKACEELDMVTQEFVPASNYPHITEEDELDRIKQWKEWCLKDD